MSFMVVVTGGRDFKGRFHLWTEMDKIHAKVKITHVIHGAAPGADTMAGQWATHRGIQEVRCAANWDKHAKAAGAMRNARMAEMKPDMVIAFPGGTGTANMKKTAIAAGIEVVEVPGAPTTR